MRHGFFKNQEAMRGGGGMSYTQSNEIHISRVEMARSPGRQERRS